MKADITREIKIVPKPEEVSWEEITELLHLAFKERADQEIDYLAVNQDVITTKKRAKGGICLIALHKNKLVGTALLHIRKGRKWYEGKNYGYFSQLGIHPDYKRRGIATMFFEERMNICHEHGVDAVTFHVSSKAKSILSLHEKLGAQKVSFFSNSNNNYYSIYLRYPVKSKEINFIYRFIRYNLTRLYVMMKKNEQGELRMLPKFLKKLIKK